MTEDIAPDSGNEPQKPSPHTAGSLLHLWLAGELPLKYEASYLERVQDSSESHLTPGLLHRQQTGEIVNAD